LLDDYELHELVTFIVKWGDRMALGARLSNQFIQGRVCQ